MEEKDNGNSLLYEVQKESRDKEPQANYTLEPLREMTTLFKLLFSRRFRNLRGLLREVRRYNPPSGDYFFDSLTFFSYLFYVRGFLIPGAKQTPAFRNAYKNISTEVFKKTYIALPVYFALRYDLQASPFASSDKLLNMLLKTYPTLDFTTLNHLYSGWKGVTQDELARRLYQHFRDYGVFRKALAGDDAEVEKWFKNFLDQTYDYVLHQAKHMTKFAGRHMSIEAVAKSK